MFRVDWIVGCRTRPEDDEISIPELGPDGSDADHLGSVARATLMKIISNAIFIVGDSCLISVGEIGLVMNGKTHQVKEDIDADIV